MLLRGVIIKCYQNVFYALQKSAWTGMMLSPHFILSCSEELPYSENVFKIADNHGLELKSNSNSMLFREPNDLSKKTSSFPNDPLLVNTS